MEILQNYDFRRPSRSQYAPVAKALLEDGAPIVKLKRGDDFPAGASMGSVQGAVSNTIREWINNPDKRTARTFVESDDVLIVTLKPEGETPRAKRKPAASRGRAVANA